MRCSRVQELYDDYTCSALPPAQMASVEEHLAACEECHAFFGEMEMLGNLLRKGDEVGHPGTDYFNRLASKVIVRVEAKHDAADADPAVIIDATPAGWMQSAWLRPARWAGSVAAAALLGAAMLPLLNRSEPQIASPLAPVTAPVRVASAVASADTVASVSPGSAVNGTAPSASRPAVLATESPNRRVVSLENTILAGVLLDPLAAEAAPQMVNKGITGIGTNTNNVEDLMKAQVAPAPNPRVENDGKSNYEQKLVARRPSDTDVLSRDITERIREVREMAAGQNGEELMQSLRELQRAAGDNPQLQRLAFIKQTRLYLKAGEALEAGRIAEASKFYIQLRMSDENSPLARRASLHLADLYYGEYADFAQARTYYGLAMRKDANTALSANEQEHAKRRLERLDRYTAQGWEPLQRLHALRKGESMDEVRASLRSLAESPAAGDLMPEAAGAIVERLRLNPSTNSNLTLEFYKLIETQAAATKDPMLRSALELSLGDLAMDQFKDLRLAIDHYRRSADTSAESEAAGVAREKLRTLDDQYFVNLVR